MHFVVSILPEYEIPDKSGTKGMELSTVGEALKILREQSDPTGKLVQNQTPLPEGDMRIAQTQFLDDTISV